MNIWILMHAVPLSASDARHTLPSTTSEPLEDVRRSDWRVVGVRRLPHLASCVLSVVLREVSVRLLVRISPTGTTIWLINAVNVVLLIVHDPGVVKASWRNLVVWRRLNSILYQTLGLVLALRVVKRHDSLVSLEASFTVRPGLIDWIHVSSGTVDDAGLRNSAVVLLLFHILVDVHDGLNPFLALRVLH